jgi:hypothetical protein
MITPARRSRMPGYLLQTLIAALILAAPGARAAPVRSSAEVGQLLDRVFADQQHRFCHDPQYPLTGQELQWCSLVPADDRRCPALRKACAGGVRAQQTGWRRSLDFDLPALPAIARTLLWTLLVLLGALVLGLLLKGALALRRVPGTPTQPKGSRGAGATPVGATLAAAVETDVLRLLQRARAAAAAGDHRRAVADAYAALLRKLEGAGVLRVEAHRTNGDYLRAVGERQPALRARVGEVMAEVERSQFGGEPPGAERFRFVHDRVVALAGERLGSLLPVLLALLLGAGACQGDRAGWDHSPSGRSALRALLAQSGLQVGERLSDLQRLQPGVNTLVLLPEAQLREGDWEHLRSWTIAGGTLVIAGKPAQPPAWLQVQFLESSRDAAAPVVPNSARDRPSGKNAGRKAGQVAPEAAVIVPPGSTRVASKVGRALLSRGASHYAIQVGPEKEGQGRAVAFADDHLFCNAALLAPGNARFLVALLSAGGPRVQFAGELMGVVAPNPVVAVTRGRLAPFLLQLGLCTLLFFIYRGAHFGRPRPQPAARRRAFADHVRALGLAYARARAGRVALEHYGMWATERLGERLRLGGAARLSGIAEGTAARTGRPVGEVMRLLVEARPTEGRSPAGSPTGDDARGNLEAMADLRALAALVAETSAQRGSPDHPAPPPSSDRRRPLSPAAETRNP